MSASKEKTEQILASEVFSPQLSEQYLTHYHALIEELGRTLPANRIDKIKREIVTVSMCE